MSDSKRSSTWFELSVNAPLLGTIFVHVEKPGRPLIVKQIIDDQIYRLDMDGVSSIWGSIDDWRDEFRRRTIKIVYTPEARGDFGY